MTASTDGHLALAPLANMAPRLVTDPCSRREDLQSYLGSGARPTTGLRGDALIEAVESAGLRGRGGAAFPAGVKLRSVRGRPGPRFVVANGEEGEPASIKDRWLLRNRPHLVLDGLLRVAEAIDAQRAVVFVSDLEAARNVAVGIEELGQTATPVQLATAEPAYVAGEETAVIRAINGGPALPTDKPPRPFEAGVDGRPTLLMNVETLANIPQIAVHGASAFRALGTSNSPGTFLCTVSGACERPGLYELALGTTLREALERAAVVSTPSAFLMGGFFGGILSPRIVDVRLGYDELRDEGSGLGCGAVVVIGEDDCPIAAAADVMSYFARENAKQCGACIRGTAAMRDVILDLARGAVDGEQIDRLRGWSLSLRERGACALLDGAAGLAASLLREFPAEVQSHQNLQCTACRCHVGPEPPTSTRFAIAYDITVPLEAL